MFTCKSTSRSNNQRKSFKNNGLLNFSIYLQAFVVVINHVKTLQDSSFSSILSLTVRLNAFGCPFVRTTRSQLLSNR